MDGDFLIVALGGQGGVSWLRVYNAEVAEVIVTRLNQIQGYSASSFNDPSGAPGPHVGYHKGNLGPKQV